MQQNIYYTKYALQFADMQIPELVRVFNSQVHSRAWSSMRAYHDAALLDEFQHRGIDVSAVYDGKAISFNKNIDYNTEANRLVSNNWQIYNIVITPLVVCSLPLCDYVY